MRGRPVTLYTANEGRECQLPSARSVKARLKKLVSASFRKSSTNSLKLARASCFSAAQAVGLSFRILLTRM